MKKLIALATTAALVATAAPAETCAVGNQAVITDPIEWSATAGIVADHGPIKATLTAEEHVEVSLDGPLVWVVATQPGPGQVVCYVENLTPMS